MNRMFAIVEREMRKFFRSPALMMVSMIFPLVQLLVLGNAFGGKIKDAKLGLVDEDGGTQAIRIHEAFDSVRVVTTVKKPSDANFWAIALTALGILAVFRWRLGMAATFGGCAAAGVALHMTGAIG